MKCRLRLGSLFFALAVIAVSSSLGGAQTPSQEQLELIKSLSPADREKLVTGLGGVDTESVDAESSKAESTGSDGLRRRDLQGKQVKLEDAPLKGGDIVLLTLNLAQPAAETLPIERREQLTKIMNLVRERNPYALDRDGVLQLPGFKPIYLSGLTDQQATKRLQADPSLVALSITLTKLPLDKVGSDSLKPFGYDLFEKEISTFAPSTNVPVPSTYLMGPGDQLVIQLFGSQNKVMRLAVGRDGNLAFPEIGPISVSGRTFDDVANEIEQRVAKQFIGAQASVSMGAVRSIQIFIVGDVQRPGSYTVSGLATVTSALYASGGIKPTGSLRSIQLKRRGTVIRELDLYDLLLRGDTSSDIGLAAGDVIFIPPVGSTAAIDGEVKRPAIYELKRGARLSTLIELAGGLTPQADPSRVTLVRYAEAKSRVAIDLALSDSSAQQTSLANGDVVRIDRLRPSIDSGVTVEGHVFRPGVTAWREGMRISNLIPSLDELMPNADINYVLIRRESVSDKSFEFLSADLAAALRGPGSIDDLLLAPKDRILIFDFQASRRLLIDPLLEELRRQARLDDPTRVVTINGRVKAPGEYPLEPGMRVSDLIRAGGKLDPAAYIRSAELARFSRSESDRKSELIEVDVGAVLRGDASADLVLQPFDILTIKELPEWSARETITLSGEVRFPGTYPIRRGETLRSVLERAGGLSALAFTRGAVFSRESIREREIQQAKQLSLSLRKDLATASIQLSQSSVATESGQKALEAQALLAQLDDVKPVGRLVINLDQVISRNIGSRDDVLLADGDELFIPKISQEVAVIGEVQNTTAHVYRSGLTVSEYIDLSGGFSERADSGRVYVVRADGSVVTRGGGWLKSRSSVVIQPGDTIVVPLDVNRLPALPFWQAVTTIIYNAAVALAAINSI